MVFHHRRRILALRHQPLVAGRSALAGHPSLWDRGGIPGPGLSDLAIQRYQLVPVLCRTRSALLVQIKYEVRGYTGRVTEDLTNETSGSQHRQYVVLYHLDFCSRDIGDT